MAAGSFRVGRALALAVLCAAPAVSAALVPDLPPEPELGASPAVSAAELETLAPGDVRRGRLLAQLAIRSHQDAVELEAQEEIAHRVALGRWREGRDAARPGEHAAAPAPVRATPRADALRAEAVRFTERALEEGSASPELPAALLVAGIDADRIGRPRDALRMLGIVIRRHSDDPHVADAWLFLGEHHLRTGDLTPARFAFDEAERRGRAPVRAWAAARNADASLAASDLQGAVAAAERALDAGSSRARDVLERAAATAASASAPGAPQLRRRIVELLERASRSAPRP